MVSEASASCFRAAGQNFRNLNLNASSCTRTSTTSSDAKLATPNEARSDRGSSASAYFQSKKFVRLASVDHIASVMSANTQPGDSSLGSPGPHPVPERLTKRQKIAVACDACRTRKVKCDGIRPSKPCSP
jgi:hypothetical protein